MVRTLTCFSREGLTLDVVCAGLRHTILHPIWATLLAASLTAPSSPLAAAVSPCWRYLALALASTGLILSANTYLDRQVANNWRAPSRWDWDREIVLVTGGSRGIGESIIRNLLKRNPRTTIVVVDLAPPCWDPADFVPVAYSEKSTRVHYYQCDLSDPAALAAVCARVRTEVGDPTVLVNNAGVARGSTLLEGPASDRELTLRTNLLAPLLLTREFLPAMAARDHGHIVSLCSMSSIVAPARIADYAASKAGLAAAHDALQLELRYVYPHASTVRQTLAIPGFIRTDMVKGDTGDAHFIAPMLHVDTVGEAIAEQLYSGYGGTIIMPIIMRLVMMLRGGPEWLFRVAFRIKTVGYSIDYSKAAKPGEDSRRLV